MNCLVQKYAIWNTPLVLMALVFSSKFCVCGFFFLPFTLGGPFWVMAAFVLFMFLLSIQQQAGFGKCQTAC